MQTTEIPITAVRPDPQQPRKTFDPTALSALAASIKHNGLILKVYIHDVGALRSLISRLEPHRAAGVQPSGILQEVKPHSMARSRRVVKPEDKK